MKRLFIMLNNKTLGGLLILLTMLVLVVRKVVYPGLDAESDCDQIINIPPADDFVRGPVTSGSFAEWLRQLPLYNPPHKVRLYNGRLKSNQTAHFRVVDMDIGSQNLQQCADAIIRLRAEYLYSRQQFDQIRFNFTSGDTAKFTDWIDGRRPRVNNNQVKWIQTDQTGSEYSLFRQYLKTVFMYAGSYSLSRELEARDIEHIEIGDVFIQGGFPGHAIVVVDMAISEITAQKAILLAQSYMPAQEIHVLRNPRHSDISPWYLVGSDEKLYTPEWTFDWTDVKQWIVDDGA
jgi:hypothetical protein